ncbi:ribokinase [Ruania suaedae]|uniref:ribokinase n=1 Tax=Ruania suaedae TaxID=2897774 RepID=UPI001E5EF71D|nr:ribokinase [Ruania suaedae]UFU01883.1 ribokinase [Ruania suaedae]
MTIAVVGSVNTDVVARVPRIPRPGETVLGTDLVRGGGGKGANQAVAAARAGGAEVTFVGAVGEDPEGGVLRTRLEADGVDTHALITVPGPSGTALITVDEAGENAIVVAPGANGARESLTDTQREAVAAARVVVAQLEVPVPLVLDVAASRSPEAILVLNAAPSAPLADPETARAVLAVTDVLVVNEHELADIAGTEQTEEAITRLTAQVPAVVVTLGGQGVLVAVGEDRRQVPAFPVTAVDTTGAGDTFCGVLAAHLSDLTADALARAARTAAAAAALAVTRAGAMDAVPTTDEVAALLAAEKETV